ncbi:cache domain-containing protein, partial [Bradyrhizobium sp.]|uniref:cache domain-containing protein n=1 Tax=Bradyrhizobium sp. TaxID=376 RepID=UPI0025C36BF5
MKMKLGSRLFDQAFVRSGPIRWLVVGGTLLIAAIAIGSVLMAQNFRERALRNSGRELENAVLLLAHHFDQQLQDFAVIQKDFVDHVRTAGITSGGDYRKHLSGEDVHRMLRSKIDALPYMGGVNIIDADGNLINSSTAWPAPRVNVADRAYFRTFKYDPYAPDVLIEPLHSRVSGAWTILVARRIVAPNGEFLGVVGRGIEPASFEKFFASVVLGEGATISMLHRDGTLLARYPHSQELMGRNFKTGPFEHQ